MRELLARTYVQCGKNDFRLVEDHSGAGGSQRFKIVEYQTLSHLINVQEDTPENTKGVQYRAVLEPSCAQKRIYTLSRAGSEWRGQWSAWAPCGKLDPDNPFVLTAGKAGEATEIIKRAGVWSLTGPKYNTEPKPTTCEDVPSSGGDWNTWLRGFFSRRGVVQNRRFVNFAQYGQSFRMHRQRQIEREPGTESHSYDEMPSYFAKANRRSLAPHAAMAGRGSRRLEPVQRACRYFRSSQGAPGLALATHNRCAPGSGNRHLDRQCR